MTYSSRPVQIPFPAGNYPTEEDRNTKGGYPIVIKKEPSIQHLQNVVTNYVDNVAPEQYQRPLSWSKDEKKAFLESLFMDRVEGVRHVPAQKQVLEPGPQGTPGGEPAF